MGETWRLIDTGSRSCLENLALDKMFLTGCANSVPSTLRFFQYNSRSILIGLYQKAEQEIRIKYCQEKGIAMNRRLTGGGAIYCDESVLGWEILLPRGGRPLAARLRVINEKVDRALVCALEKLGVSAVCQKNNVEVQESKLGWLGAAASQDYILYQGYLRVNDFDGESMLKALRIPNEKVKNKQVVMLNQTNTCLKWVLGKNVSSEEVKQALTAGFAESFDILVKDGSMTPDEISMYSNYYNELSHSDWLSGYKTPASPFEGQLLRYTLRETCTIDVSLFLDKDYQRIKAASISGDFFAFPNQAVSTLEDRLCGVIDRQVIHNKLNDFFNNDGVYIQGLAAGDFYRAIMAAIEKVKLIQAGICSAGAVNDIVIVGAGLFPGNGNKASNKSIPLLLPYCAKKVTCKLRYIEGCSQCGGCDIGQAYNFADKYGLEPITIQNFEMLEDKLNNLKKRECPFFIGTCCEAFWVKHRKDFERIGLPGILINIDDSTCYELGKEQDAYQGTYENQTRLKNNLIERVIRSFV